MDQERIVNAFYSYASAYDVSNPKIKVKIDHTLKVAKQAEQIAENIGADADLAWLCGMLHDIGRFEQLRRYDTFVDDKSIDHAALSCELLFKDGLIERFVTDDIRTDLLETAIRYHSLYRLPQNLSDEERMYCQILRDADKLDIFRAICDTPLTELYGFSMDELKTSEVSEEVRECFDRHSAVLKSMWRTPADIWAAHICLYFELVYPISREIAHEQGYLEQLLRFESDHPATATWFKHVRETVCMKGTAGSI